VLGRLKYGDVRCNKLISYRGKKVMIKNIIIKEIKGIQSKEFKFNVVANKPNLFVAPNGFGKSSFAKSFSSMKTTGIDLDINDRYKQDINTNPEIQIHMNSGEIFMANSDSNDILSEFSVQVINSQLYPKASTKNFGPFRSTQSNICVRPIKVINTIPTKTIINYSYSNIKSSFGNMGKLITNMKQILNDPDFIIRLSAIHGDLKKFTQVRKKAMINSFLNNIKEYRGTKQELLLKSYDFSIINGDEGFNKVLSLIMKTIQVEIPTITEYLNTIQIIDVFNNNKSNMTKIYKYYNYLHIKEELDSLLTTSNTTWQNIKTKKSGSSLILELPSASEISNGERDILCFLAKLYEAKSKLTKARSILIIDEIFDYLDDGNLITAQYYINKMIEDSKNKGKKIYPIILTHLDPQYFKTYLFKLKNINYLDTSIEIINKYNINNALKHRKAIEKLATHFLHYNPEEVIENKLKEYNVDEVIINSSGMYNAAKEEINRYIEDKKYDVALVCIGLRIHIEKSVFVLLNEDKKSEFLDIHGTSKKLDYVSDLGIVVPEIYYLLGIIYNEVLHLDPQCKKLISIGQKLNNKVIKNMISDVFKNRVLPSTYCI
jgi:hypothetical protein